MERKVDVAIIGAGTAGLFALSKVRRATDRWVLINGGELGTTCARVGCMPSKVAIQVAEDFHRRRIFGRHGIQGMDALDMDIPEALEHVRDLRDIFVDKVLSGSTDQMGDEFMEGYARFVEPGVLDVEGTIVRARKVIIATGSRPFIPEAWRAFGDRILTTDELFEQEELPASMAVIGLGAVGLEMGQALHRMGVEVTGVDRLDTIAGLQDPVVQRAAIELIGAELPLWLGDDADVGEENGKLRVRCGERSVLVDKILASIGRVPNVERLGLDALGVPTDARGVPLHDPNTLQVGDLPVFIAGDVTGERAILHEAGHEGRIAGYNAVQDTPVKFRRTTPLAITFCDPNIATVGADWNRLDPDKIAIGEVNFGVVGRALIMAKNKGVLRVYADKRSGRVLGASMAAPKGENLAHLIAWSIEQGLTVFDMLRMPFYHPVIEEGLQAALFDVRDKIEQRPQEPVDLERL